MTIDEAIEQLERYKPLPELVHYHVYLEAVQLGIEALKLIRDYRHDFDLDLGQLLPGETEK